MEELLKKTYNDISNNDILNIIKSILLNNKKALIVTSNPEIYVNSLTNKKIHGILFDKNTIIIPDSVAIEYALKKVLNKEVKRIPGVELLVDILKEADVQKKSIYLYGATEEVNIKFKNYVNNNYKDIKILGSKNGYIKETNEVENDIIKKQPDIVVAALGVPKQEEFLYKVSKKMDKGLFIGVGGSFDVLSGSIKRAPKIFIKLKLEWLYRIVKQPKRIKRFYKYNIKFMKIIKRCYKK